ncbi:hypothetical protein MNAN1_001243 [Malassezia nana]|uniref:Protein BOI2 n=1 Tax=Malassezia nana TaxID=180528 RepID=A0AAF0EP08_9BASI|nr:hypothetical protein MNAN1_001243 [Malassezia nana]
MTVESVEYVYALYNFDAENPDEVSFRVGERVRVIEKDDAYGDGWYQGTNERGETGLFPFSYTTYDESAAQMMVTGAQSTTAESSQAHAEPGVLHSTMNDIDHALSELNSPRTGDWDDENEAEPDFAARAAARAALARNAQKSLAEAAYEQEAEGAWPAASGLGEPGSISSAGPMGLTKAPGITPLAMLEMSDESEDEDDAAQALVTSTSSTVAPPPEPAKEERQLLKAPAQSVPESPESPFGVTPPNPSTMSAQPMQLQPLTQVASLPSEPLSLPSEPQPAPLPSEPAPQPSEPAPLPSEPLPEPSEPAPGRPEEVSIPGSFAVEPPTPVRDPKRLSSAAPPPASAPVLGASKPPVVTTPPRPATLGSHPSGAPSGDPMTWTVDDVVAWARSKNYDAQTIEKLAEHEISGDALLAMDIHLLKEIDIVAFGRRFHLANGIKELQERVAPTPMPVAPTPPPVSPWKSTSGAAWTSPPVQPSPVFRDGPSASPSMSVISGLAPPASWASIPSATPLPWEAETPAAPMPRTVAPPAAEPPAPAPLAKEPMAPLPVSPPIPPPTAPPAVPDRAAPSGERESRHRFHLRPVRAKSGARAAAADKSQISLPTSNSHFTPPPAPPKDETRKSAAQEAPQQPVLQRIGAVDKQGWIKKRGERYNTWNTRYLVLQGHDLLVLRDPNAERVKSHISLQGYKVVSDESAPGRYSFKIVHETQRTHQFSLEDPVELRSWMKAVMKATIGRDTSQPVISSYSNPTISLEEAQRRRPRPPSPSTRHRSQLDVARESAELQVARDMAIYGPGNELAQGL